MGSHRKSKGPSHQRKNSLSSPSSHNLAYDVQAEETHAVINEDNEILETSAQNLDFSQVLQDVEGSLVGTMTGSVMAITGLVSGPTAGNGSLRVTWKEMGYLSLAIVVLSSLSVFMGIAAGITISIHYFDGQVTPTLPGMGFREPRTTAFDPSIVSTNIMHPSGDLTDDKEPDLILGKVITMSESGQYEVLLVVEETAPLHPGENQTNNSSVVFDNKHIDDTELLLDGAYKPYRHKGPPNVKLSSSKIHPTICSDGVTIGFDNWDTLRAAVDEANFLSAEKFMKWNEFFASLPDDVTKFNWYYTLDWDEEEDDLLYYYEEDIVLTICPGTTLKSRRGPIFINSENLIIECGGDAEEYEVQFSFPHPSNKNMPACSLDGGGTHLSFGPHARNVLIRGFMFRSAKTSSLAFHFNGAQVSFEDCVWMDNKGVHGRYGAVADVNSTSQVNFYRCEISPNWASGSNVANDGDDLPQENAVPAYGGLAPDFASFLSLRT